MRLGSVGGTQIHVETSFVVVVGVFVILNLEGGRPLHEALLWVPLLFVSVLIHELGHAGTLALMGFGSSHIALAGFGGVTINRRQAQPWQDLIIAVAGPVCSFLLAGIALLMLWFVPYFSRDPFFAAFLPLVVLANVFWGIFNLLPIHPLDGGHALRNLLRHFLDPRASEIGSCWVSIVFSVGILGLSLVGGQWFIALFSAMFAWQNYQRLQMVKGFKQPGPEDDDTPPDQNE